MLSILLLGQVAREAFAEQSEFVIEFVWAWARSPWTPQPFPVQASRARARPARDARSRPRRPLQSRLSCRSQRFSLPIDLGGAGQSGLQTGSLAECSPLRIAVGRDRRRGRSDRHVGSAVGLRPGERAPRPALRPRQPRHRRRADQRPSDACCCDEQIGLVAAIDRRHFRRSQRPYRHRRLLAAIGRAAPMRLQPGPPAPPARAPAGADGRRARPAIEATDTAIMALDQRRP
jgi:hypothetical protein